MINAATALVLFGYVNFIFQTTDGVRVPSYQNLPSEDRFNYFDAELIQEVTKRQDGNVLISPASVKAALLMVLEGAKGRSADEIRDVLRLPDDKDYYRLRTQKFLQNFMVKSSVITAETANRIFISNDLKPYAEYRDGLQKYYFADVSEVNFTSPTKAASVINDWIDGATHGLIPKLVDADSLPPDTKVMITNAVYFKGTWKIAFDADGTVKRCFYDENNECRYSNFMETLSYYKYGYISALDAEAVEILYSGEQFSMVILLPSKRGRIGKLIRDLSHSPLAEIIDKMDITEVLLSIPRFNITYDTELVPVLQKLEIKEVFGAHANLSGIASNIGTAHISQILHSTRIAVNEEGTIAGAGTGVLVVPLMGTTIPRFRADSPFLFLICDRTTGSILFGGRVSTPEEAITPPSAESSVSQPKVENSDRKEETNEYYHLPQAPEKPGQSINVHQRPPLARPPIFSTFRRPTYQQPQSNDRDAIQFSGNV